MFDAALVAEAERLLDGLAHRGLKIVTAESCTGGLIAALLTEPPGSSRVVERGFVTYSNEAKAELLGIDMGLITRVGAVSSEVAIAMAEGALDRSRAHVAVAVTGLAGPDGGTAAKPIGLVHIAVAARDGLTVHRECRFGPIGRSAIRIATVGGALALVRQAAGLD